MPSDYNAIRAENERRYGTDIGRIGPMLLAERYAERTHFIYELLQNAEDALVRRGSEWNGPRGVDFRHDGHALRVSHYGDPFDERDVRGICGIAESLKERTAIGCFGIGFKSVYAFTGRPEVHSGEENFVIEKFVWPAAAPPVERQEDETVFILPLWPEDDTAVEEITAGLRRLGPRALLFLRAIEEISWGVENGYSGHYLRDKPDRMARNVRRVDLVWQEGQDDAPADETWLIFSRPVKQQGGETVGYVEVAFRLDRQEDKDVVRRVGESPLVVFFPTVLETHLGFLVQGPYRTTPSRDNVPQDDSWNKHLVQQTADLLVEALRALRDMNLLDADSLRVLPLDRSRFSEGRMFAPLFEGVRTALRAERLLPCFGGGHVAASQAKLARVQELRELFSPGQLAALFAQEREVAWLSGDITQDRTPELRQYLMQELEVAEVTPESILAKLGKSFLEAQNDKWIVSLYEFLKERPALHRRLEDVPLLRLTNETHVKLRDASGQPQAFLPSAVETGFPTVKASVCSTDGAREFLKSLGLREPDLVDDVVLNVLPKYSAQDTSESDENYADDIRRIVTAFHTDSKSQRDKLLKALRECDFVKAVDAGDGSKAIAKPGAVYLPTQRLKALFGGVSGVQLVDHSYECLRGEEVRELLEACGATRYLRPVPVQPHFTWEECQEMRRKAGCERNTGPERFDNNTLLGLEELLVVLPTLDVEAAANRCKLLWEALAELESRGHGAFLGRYYWFYYTQQSSQFDATFVRRLNEAAWVPAANSTLQTPGKVLFETTGWTPNPFLLSKICFKPPVVEQLAREAGIEPGVIELLRKLGVTSEVELKKRLGIKEEPQQLADHDVSGKPKGGSERGTRGETGSGGGKGAGAAASGQGGRRFTGMGDNDDKRTPSGTGQRTFISYVAVHPNEEEVDPDGLDQEARMALEEKAIQLILQYEPQLHRTPTHNPGYDLFETGDDEQTIRWVEVKAMTRSLNDRPVGLSRTQFLECARQHGKAYWLYVVEHAGSPKEARIVRIQDPAGMARTFTFDRGWLSVADIGDNPALS